MDKRINTMYFSATGTTEKVVTGIGEEISNNFGQEIRGNNINFTLPKVRKEVVAFAAKDIVIMGVPVYAGRVPNVLLDYLNSIKGNGALAVAVVLYGNRDYDDALIELRDILEEQNFKVIAGGAFIGEHSFSKTLAASRPDAKDMVLVKDFAKQIYNKLKTEDNLATVTVKGNKPYRKYYMPENEDDEVVDIRKVIPKTKDDCVDCKLCAKVCPMGSITLEDVSILDGICIKCGACIKKCPTNAKYYDDEDYLRHKCELERDFSDRKEPELFL